MPTMPKWLGDASEKYFSSSYQKVKVASVELITNKLKRIRFIGDLSGIKQDFKVGQVIEFRVSDNEYRHYTPSYFSKEEGICDVIFYLHDKGVGSKWAQALKVGDSTKLIGPGGKLYYEDNSEFHFIFGDETSIGLMEIFKEKINTENKKGFYLTELHQDNLEWKDKFPFNIVSSDEDYSDKILMYLKSIDIQKITCYLTGNMKSMKPIRQLLRTNGVGVKQIKSDPYWLEGKKGL